MGDCAGLINITGSSTTEQITSGSNHEQSEQILRYGTTLQLERSIRYSGDNIPEVNVHNPYDSPYSFS